MEHEGCLDSEKWQVEQDYSVSWRIALDLTLLCSKMRSTPLKIPPERVWAAL